MLLNEWRSSTDLSERQLHQEQRQALLSEARHLQQVICRIRQLGMDQAENTYFKVLLLLRPECRGITQQAQVEHLQDQTQLVLQEYCRTKGQQAPASGGRVQRVS